MKKSKLIVCLLQIILTGVTCFSQGVQFEETLNWEQVLAKAKTENKYIFVDCYATWCGPCKLMDKHVYTQPEVGKAANRDFISVKIQMDSTAQDDMRRKQWYKVAAEFAQEYHVTALPSFIIFSPSGEAVHKGIGYKEPQELVSLLRDALDPDKQFFARLNQYRQHKLSMTSLPALSLQAKSLGFKEIGQNVAKDYKSNYLDKLTDENLCTKENFDFLNSNWDILTSKDRYFFLCYNYPGKVDSVSRDISWQVVNFIITKEELSNKLWKNNIAVTEHPDWDKLQRNIKSKYKKVSAKDLVLEEQLNFYKRNGNWGKYAIYRDKKIASRPLKIGGGFQGDAWKLNADAWDVFLKCTDKEVLTKALNWMDISIKLADEGKDNVLFAYYDTKASILYKLGQKDLAIATEERAIEIATSKGESYLGYSKVLEKMKKNEPIYDAVWD